MTSTRALLAEVRACRLCEAHLPLGPRPVLQLHAQARILIAGQAPGRRVHESGVPFDDASGERLRSWLGVTAAQFYDPRLFAIVPMGLCYPGTGRSGDLPPRPECAATWRTRLLAPLRELQLTLVIGRYAIDWHFDAAADPLTEQVKAWHTHWPSRLALPHPSPRNNGWLKRNAWFERELLPVVRQRIAEIAAR
jgi:uracil-DNA glycosylase